MVQMLGLSYDAAAVGLGDVAEMLRASPSRERALGTHVPSRCEQALYCRRPLELCFNVGLVAVLLYLVLLSPVFIFSQAYRNNQYKISLHCPFKLLLLLLQQLRTGHTFLQTQNTSFKLGELTQELSSFSGKGVCSSAQCSTEICCQGPKEHEFRVSLDHMLRPCL